MMLDVIDCRSCEARNSFVTMIYEIGADPYTVDERADPSRVKRYVKSKFIRLERDYYEDTPATLLRVLR